MLNPPGLTGMNTRNTGRINIKPSRNLGLGHLSLQGEDGIRVGSSEFGASSTLLVDRMGDGFKVIHIDAVSVATSTRPDVIDLHPLGNRAVDLLPRPNMGGLLSPSATRQSVPTLGSGTKPDVTPGFGVNPIVLDCFSAVVTKEVADGETLDVALRGTRHPRRFRWLAAPTLAQAGRIRSFDGILGMRHGLSSFTGRVMRRAGGLAAARLFVASNDATFSTYVSTEPTHGRPQSGA